MQRDLGRFSPWGRFLHYGERASQILRDEIRRGRREGATGRTDVLAMMLDARDEAGTPMSEDEIHDELVTLLTAGHETTATALAWALRWILPDRGLVARLRDEIATADGNPQRVAAPDPDRFLPDRFLSFKPSLSQWLPFGGGLRKCIGAAFAVYEMKMVLAAMLPRIDARLATNRIRIARRGVTVTPAGGLPIVVTARRSRPAYTKKAA
jgi:cytochrome P450